MYFKMLPIVPARSQTQVKVGRQGIQQIESVPRTANFMPPADTAALMCLSFTNACVVSTIVNTIIIFRCGRIAPPHSKRLGLKYFIVHFCNQFTQ